jgi:hypothetical protein
MEGFAMRRLLVVAGALGLLGLVGLFLVGSLLAPGPGVTRENFLRLRAGMRLAEVEATLGGRGSPIDGHGPEWSCVWQRETTEIVLRFDGQRRLVDGVAIGEGWTESFPSNEGFLDRLRRLLPW